MYKIPQEVILQIHSPGHWIIHNLFALTCLGIDCKTIGLLTDLETQSIDKLREKYASDKFSIRDIGYFSNYNGLVEDPTRWLRDIQDWPDVSELDIDSTLMCLKENFLIVDDFDSYVSKFAPKTSLVDGEHFGNFHQQLGQELLIRRREQPETWWLKQKFTENYKDIRPGLYKSVQASYLTTYFERKIQPQQTILDVGCGVGFYSNMMARSGASVLGVDPNDRYIEIAQTNAVANAEFEVMEVGKLGGLDEIQSESFDLIFMSDALLFYFFSDRPTQEADIEILLSSLHRLLKPDGCLVSVEPHYLFWLRPWMGSEKRPYTILTEYQNKNFGVTPTISTLIQAFTQNNFAITWMDEMMPEDELEDTNPRAFYFAKEFPMWQLFELKPV